LERFKESYSDVYGGGTSEGVDALNYFEKWGYYATIFDLAGGDLFKIDRLLKESVHKTHVVLACRNDTMKLKHKIQTQK
tara:strand:- start:254 stop:490 length:237 start_codon:yes stop_codon:yes gene_type:complete